MWIAHVICSGPGCDEELELVAESLEELDRLNCECGYGFAVLSVAEASLIETAGAEVVQLTRDVERAESRRAA